MNAGIVTSFVVGGILLLAILAMNLNISRSSSGLTMRQITQQNVNTVSDFINYDFPKIGYKQLGKISPAISTATANSIVFESDLNNDGTIEQISWVFDTSGPTPHLYRTVAGDQTDINVGVTRFELSYLDDDRDPLTTPVLNPSDIRYIKVNLVVSSKEKLGGVGPGDGEYLKSPWERTFSPKNLQ